MFDGLKPNATRSGVQKCLRAAGALAIVVAAAAITVHAEIIEQILVKVNGDIFTKTDLEQRQVQALRQKGQQFDLKSDPNNEQLRKALDEITPQIMVDAVDEMLIVQRGKELGYKLSDEQFKGIVDNIRKENKIDTEEQFQNALKSEGMTMADLRKNVERSVLVQRVQQNEVLGKISVTEAEARKYYQGHLNDFTTTPTVTLREVLVSVKADAKGLNVAADEVAQKKADDIRARVAGGASFEKAASDESDAPSKANAGLIGPINLNDLSADLRKLIDSMKPGDISQVLRTRTGYQILKLETKTAAQTMTFEQARDQISERVAGDKRNAEFLKYLEKLRGQAIIEWKNNDVKRAFDEGLKQKTVLTAAQ